MSAHYTFTASRTLDSITDTIEIKFEGGKVVADPLEKRVHRKFKPRVMWHAPFKFWLDFRKMGNSPVDNGKHDFEATFDGTVWSRSIKLKDVVYDTRLEYDIVTDFGTLDPALIIDPN